MADVLVKFGAQLDDLIDGVKGAKTAIESVGESTDKITEGFRTLAEVAGVSISIEGFKTFVQSMAELGSHTQDSMARLGQSAEQITTLQGVAGVAGISFEGLQQSIEKASLNIQKSTKDAYNPAAQALKVLGLNVRDLTGIPADQWFSKIADAVSKFNPSLNLTNAVTAAFGRGTAQMLPLLLQGSEKFNEMSAAVKKAQEGLAQAIPGMADTHEKLALMGTSIQSLGARIFTVLKPAIDGAVKWFTNWVQSIDTATIMSAAQGVSTAILSIIQSVGTFAINAMGYVDDLGISLDGMIKKISLVATGAAAGGILGAFMGGVGAVPGALLGGATGAAVDELRHWIEGYEKTAKDGEAKMKARKDALAKMGADTKTMLDNMLKGLQTGVSTAATGKQDAGGIDAGIKDQLGAQASRIEAQISAEQAKFQRIKEILGREALEYKITEQQKGIFTETALQQMYEAEMAAMDAKIRLYPKDSKAYEDAQKEKAKLTQDYQKQMVATVDEAQKQMVQTITTDLSMVTSSFNSQLRGLLAGTTSWASAMKNITGDLFMKMIELGEKWAVDHAAIMIKDVLFTETTEASKVTAAAAAEAAKTAATVTGVAARAAAETTGATAGIGTQIAAAITSIGIDAGKVFAGIFGFLAPVMGPAAAGPAAAGEAETFAAGMAPLATGAWEIPGVMPALLHPGEIVMPKPYAQAFRSAVSGGGGGQGSPAGPSIVFAPNVSSFNPSGMQATLRSMLPQLASMLRQYQNLNPSTQ